MSIAEATSKLKQLDARIEGMRLALATSCTSCDVEAVVNLLKSISVEIRETLLSLSKKESEPSQKMTLKDAETYTPDESAVDSQPDPNAYQNSEMYQEIEKIIDGAFDPVKVSEIKTSATQDSSDSEQFQQDMKALSSLMGHLSQEPDDNLPNIVDSDAPTAKEVSELIQLKDPDVYGESEQKLDIRHLATPPVQFNIPQASPEDFINGNRDTES